jgi:2-C-methyl-D-erythritol 4-phosphate cytidylyltransferase
MRATAIIVGAGSGKRLGASKPKAFVEVGGVPLLIHSLRALLGARGVSEAVLVIPPNSRAACVAMLGRYEPWHCPISVVDGGSERQDSVRAGLELVGNSDLVAVHDAARPFVTPTLVEHALELAARHGAAIVAVPARDTVKQVHPDGWIEATPPRQSLWLAQTPQIFRTDILRRAHEQACLKGLVASDDATLVESLGVRVYVVTGNDENRKITTQEDLRWAEWFLSVKRP